MINLRETFGGIDIYLFDQLLKERLVPGGRVLDAGCGSGRNLVYLLGQGFDVWAVDQDATALGRARSLAAGSRHESIEERFRVADIDALPFENGSFDFVISSAVLHFSRDETHFGASIRDMWRVLDSGGVLFARLASTIGIEDVVRPKVGRWFQLPDGSDRFLVDENLLMAVTNDLAGKLLDPLKTTVVQGMRSMTTWVIQKP